MEDIANFRIFLSFPLVGLFIPDIGLFLTGSPASALPVTHAIIGITLLVCIFRQAITKTIRQYLIYNNCLLRPFNLFEVCICNVCIPIKIVIKTSKA